MLRRKLLMVFGPLVGLLAGMAVWAVWSLQGVLGRLDRIHVEGAALVESTGQLNTVLTAIETELYRLQSTRQRHLDALIDAVERADRLADQIGEAYSGLTPAAEPIYTKFRGDLGGFEAKVRSLATAQDASLILGYNIEALQKAVGLHGLVGQLDRLARRHLRQEQAELAVEFRRLVLGMAVGFLVLINASIVALLWAAGRVLRPVDQLVQASRQLQQEKFDHRTHLTGKDEFTELAEAYNSLAERVQQHEKGRMETISQMALTLNHELNNVLETLELQLQLLGQRSGGDDRVKVSLEQMRHSLQRMARTVESVKHIKRIVLTDYIAGVKMLDLHRSTQADSGEAPADFAAPGKGPTP